MLAVWRWFLWEIVVLLKIVVIHDRSNDNDEANGCDCCETAEVGSWARSGTRDDELIEEREDRLMHFGAYW